MKGKQPRNKISFRSKECKHRKWPSFHRRLACVFSSLALFPSDVVPRTCSHDISLVFNYLRLHRQYSHIDCCQSTFLPQNSVSGIHLGIVNCRLRCALSAEFTNCDQIASTSDFVRLRRVLSDGCLSSSLGLARLSDQY